MRQTNSRRIAVAGVLAAAVLAAVLVMPASRQLGTSEGLWLAAATLGVPTIGVLVATSFRYYGLARSLAIGTVIAVVTCVVSLVVAAFTFATALSGSVTGLLLAIVLFGAPALTVAILGLVALRLAPSQPSTAREHESVG
ncbi:hypothetical protein [Mycolicibacterium celeriflavum]|uniref:Uncharacterized protein n=1 Tax=Mycolicibacterium celeriflavum TaxID=1249101 RepID=A0A1X0BM14_MYCCF|nr:hypothetical protein [Mycolicibacterium celeriflavum]MCV7236645.1 hypothetical protein [Mycolicibacterium celeriflavum]ORA43835.1 hypothetical protein BST21_21115 [Mycolicibacterium celeriflavum]BBY43795.1 hypothetical protein MCEL_20900 [Mycolicibacterium celeriflavum]